MEETYDKMQITKDFFQEMSPEELKKTIVEGWNGTKDAWKNLTDPIDWKKYDELFTDLENVKGKEGYPYLDDIAVGMRMGASLVEENSKRTGLQKSLDLVKEVALRIRKMDVKKEFKPKATSWDPKTPTPQP